MSKIFFLFSCLLVSGTAFAGGIDMEFFGYKVCNVGFDVNPFSRDDGRSSTVHVVSCAPQYYTPPPRITGTASAQLKANQEDRAIVVKDSSNVTIVNHENQQTSRPVYAPTVRTTYPAVQYYSYPVTYACPGYYSYPRYYCRPYYGCHPCRYWW